MLLFIALSAMFIHQAPADTGLKFRSSDLQKITETDRNSQRMEFVDRNGNVTVAANLGYAVSVTEKKDRGLLIRYYDEKGEPVRRIPGYYAILREYDDCGNVIKTTFLNREGNPCNTGEGYAVEERNYDESGKLITSRYYGADGKPVCTPQYGYGMICEYDEYGNSRVTLTDTDGKAMKTEAGYASFTCRYGTTDGSENKITEDYLYFDENGEPVALSLGQYGIHKEYNEFGQGIVTTYLGADGEPAASNKGYATVVRTYGADNNVVTERYYDEKGSPFSLAEGQYGIKTENGQTVYLGKDGDPVPNLRNLLYNHPWTVILLALTAVVLSAVASRKLNIFLLVVSITVVVYLTLMYRESDSVGRIELLGYYKRVFTDSMARADIIKNIWLFIPLGAILYRLYPRKAILLVPIVLSALIEGIQLFTRIGICELDDIISNGLGGWIGFYMGRLVTDIKQIINNRKQ